MASVQKIKEGIFKISWVNSAYQYSNNVEVILPGMAELCKLSYVQSNRYGNYLQEIVLEIEISFTQAMKPNNLDTVIVLASKDGINQATNLKNSKWIATFNSLHRCCGGVGFIFEIVIDFTADSTIMKKESKHVLDNLLNLWNKKTLADVTFRFDDKIIKAHTLIVASGSPVLAAVFQEEERRTLEILDTKSTVFEHCLRFIYTGDADMDNVDVAALLVAADKYGMDSLKEECALRLSQDLTIENATQNLILAHLQNSPVLHQSTLDFMSKNAKAICSRKDWMELLKKYPELGFAAMQLMVMG